MVGRILREQAKIASEPLLDLFRIILYCLGVIRTISAFDTKRDIGPSPQVSPPLVLRGRKTPNGLAIPNIANWRRKLATTFSTGEGNEHQTFAAKKVNRRSQQKPHSRVDNRK